jgi:hypothetical protein
MTPETMDNCPENQHIVKPDPSVEEPVAFVFNNISNSNLEQKAQDLENVLGEVSRSCTQLKPALRVCAMKRRVEQWFNCMMLCRNITSGLQII